MELVRPTGKPLTAEIKVAAIPWSGQSAYLASIRDISDRKLAERLQVEVLQRKEAEEKFRTAVEAAPNGMLTVDARGKMLLVNREIERMFGYGWGELLGRPAEMLIPERFRQRHAAYRAGFMKGSEARRELFGRRKDGSEFPIEIGLNPFKRRGKTFVLVSVVDITQRKQLEQLREEFIRTVSHELRTPLTVIREGIAQVIELPDQEPGQIERTLSLTLKSVDRLVRIVNDLLDVSRLEAGRVELRREEVDLRELLREAAGPFQPKARAKGLGIKVSAPEQPVKAYADRDKLIQVLTNLIGNAFKFTESGRVEVSLADREGEAVFTVSDTGPGIAKEDLPKLFGKFRQVGESRPGAEKGSGLGLAISKGLVELHGGRIWAESEPGAGSRFCLTLPKLKPRDLFKSHLAASLEEAMTNGEKLSAAVLDLKDFEEVQRRLGEEKLASVMLRLEEAIKKGLRGRADVAIKDTRAFLILLPETPIESARRVAQRLLESARALLAAMNLPVPLEFETRLAVHPEDGRSHERLLEKLGL